MFTSFSIVESTLKVDSVGVLNAEIQFPYIESTNPSVRITCHIEIKSGKTIVYSTGQYLDFTSTDKERSTFFTYAFSTAGEYTLEVSGVTYTNNNQFKHNLISKKIYAPNATSTSQSIVNDTPPPSYTDEAFFTPATMGDTTVNPEIYNIRYEMEYKPVVTFFTRTPYVTPGGGSPILVNYTLKVIKNGTTIWQKQYYQNFQSIDTRKINYFKLQDLNGVFFEQGSEYTIRIQSSSFDEARTTNATTVHTDVSQTITIPTLTSEQPETFQISCFCLRCGGIHLTNKCCEDFMGERF